MRASTKAPPQRSIGPTTQKGFTLVEVIIVVAILGIVLRIIGPIIGQGLGLGQRAYLDSQTLANQTIASVLLDSARTQSTLGQLPAPYSGNGYVSAVFNPTNSTLASAFQQAALSINQINDDGTNAQNVRVYQQASGLTMQMPMYFRSGPLITLTYQVGAVYSTTCALVGSGCNPSGNGIPGFSSTLTAANAATWTPTLPDFGAQIFSTLQLQKSMLQTTVSRIDDVRNAFQNYFRERERLAAADDTTNWYPAPNGPGAPNLAGGNPASNQGCYDGWYNLSDATVNVLAQVGLDQARYGTTQWGATIQYCRDYNPLATGPNSIPHYGALRINTQVSNGVAPDTLNPANNVVLTY
ncbi:type II secretion system protein [Trinickia mobilis]|uniref:type II secretion system protein n=1 Tax=Trinickia mobilis TaxID=2816356 RepID=UPI001A8FC510|nr:prepilin-type N-terminal cleavage/methylation domain-containing protein [Trinickia mobilis]